MLVVRKNRNSRTEWIHTRATVEEKKMLTKKAKGNLSKYLREALGLVG